jgi:RimJ/RimL family protein N-acetyltransferase
VIQIPRLETKRLLLRGFAQADFEAYASMVADPEVTRHLGDGQPLGRADAWRQLSMFAGHWTLRGFGPWAVEERATGTFIGRVGCIEPEGWPGLEVAYTLTRPAWGRGFAREAAAAALTYGRDVLQRARIISMIRPANVASVRVAVSLGAVREGTIEFLGSPADVYVYPASAQSSHDLTHLVEQ